MSDPFNDNTQEHTQGILAKTDSELTWDDYQCILGPHLPAGTYDESVYFLPRAFEYMLSHDEDALDLATPIFGFVSEYADDLDQDGLLDAARGRVAECLEKWTDQFTVVHYDRSACQAKGWGREYFDYVKNVEVICEGTCDLVRFERHADLAETFYRSLAANRTDLIKAAWLLELARAKKDVRHPPKHPAIRAALADREAIQSAVAIVRPLFAQEPSPTYWNDTLCTLGVAA